MASGQALNDQCVGADDPWLCVPHIHYHDGQSVCSHTKAHVGWSRNVTLDIGWLRTYLEHVILDGLEHVTYHGIIPWFTCFKTTWYIMVYHGTLPCI